MASGGEVMLDRLSAAVRHLFIVAALPALAAVILHVAGAVTSTGDVYAIDWADTFRSSVSVAAVAFFAGLSAWVGLYLTPLTRQYGVGADRTRLDVVSLPDGDSYAIGDE